MSGLYKTNVMRYNGSMNELLPALRDFLSVRGIPAPALISLSHCRITYPALLERSMPAAKTVILMTIPYFTGEHAERNLSLYAVPRDYHLFCTQLGQQVCVFLKERYPEQTFVFFADHSPIDERDAAAKCGLGVIGDNGLLITKRYGSYVFLAEIVTDLMLPEAETAPIAKPQGCIHCGKCAIACPSPNNCLSAITQKKGDLSEEEKALIRRCGTVWGCDICQTVCPLNHDIRRTEIPFFYEERIPRLTKEILDAMDRQTLRSRAFGWRGRAVIERNLCLLDPHE